MIETVRKFHGPWSYQTMNRNLIGEHGAITYEWLELEDLSRPYLRVGDVTFVNHVIPKGENVISIFPHDPNLNRGLVDYFALTVGMLQQVDLEGRNVLDLGSGTGLLSIAAAKLGAQTVVAVDNNKTYQKMCTQNANVNNINVEIVHGNISAPSRFWKKPLHEKLPDDIDTVIANIGPHYGTAHLDAIALIDHLPTVRTFIAGGYVTGKSDAQYDSLKPNAALEALQERGFTGDVKVTLNGGDHHKMAFVAQRK